MRSLSNILVFLSFSLPSLCLCLHMFLTGSSSSLPTFPLSPFPLLSSLSFFVPPPLSLSLLLCSQLHPVISLYTRSVTWCDSLQDVLAGPAEMLHPSGLYIIYTVPHHYTWYIPSLALVLCLSISSYIHLSLSLYIHCHFIKHSR